jgi:hypothetical protein
LEQTFNGSDASNGSLLPELSHMLGGALTLALYVQPFYMGASSHALSLGAPVSSLPLTPCNLADISDFVAAASGADPNAHAPGLVGANHSLWACSLANKVFTQFDVDGSGHLDARELTKALLLMHLRLTEEQTSAVLKERDLDQSGKIEPSEFEVMVLESAAAQNLPTGSARVTCGGSGVCECQPSTDTTSSGIISDGSADYANNANCSWLIASTGGLISLSFSSFNTESGYDTVTVNRCTSSSCGTVTQVAKLSGSSVSPSTIYTSSTGYMQVVFASDGSVTASGFVASWSTRNQTMDVSNATCAACPQVIMELGATGGVDVVRMKLDSERRIVYEVLPTCAGACSSCNVSWRSSLALPLFVWSHVAVVQQSTGQVDIYLNGSLAITVPSSTTSARVLDSLAHLRTSETHELTEAVAEQRWPVARTVRRQQSALGARCVSICTFVLVLQKNKY